LSTTTSLARSRNYRVGGAIPSYTPQLFSRTAGDNIVMLNEAIATETSGDSDMGQIGSYEDMSLATFARYTVNLSLQDYPVFLTPGNGGAVTYNSAWGLDGRGGVRCFAPSAEGNYAGMGGYNLFNAGGSNNFTAFYMRCLRQVGSTYGQHTQFDAVKDVIMHSQGGPNGGSDPYRPIFYWESRLGGIAPTNATVYYPAQGTSQYFASGFPGSSVFDGDGRFDDYHDPAGSGTYLGKPKYGPGDWVCFEYFIESAQTATWPDGVIVHRATSRAGVQTHNVSPSCPWNRDAAAPFTKYFYEVQVAGGYYNGVTTTPDSNTYTAFDQYVTFARDVTYATMPGPPEGFLL
jgi:hypothetical protein